MDISFRLLLTKNDVIEFNADSTFCRMDVIKQSEETIEIQTQEHYPFDFLVTGMNGLLEIIGEPGRAISLSKIIHDTNTIRLICKYNEPQPIAAGYSAAASKPFC